jgi:hypothetical protein
MSYLKACQSGFSQEILRIRLLFPDSATVSLSRRSTCRGRSVQGCCARYNLVRGHADCQATTEDPADLDISARRLAMVDFPTEVISATQATEYVPSILHPYCHDVRKWLFSSFLRRIRISQSMLQHCDPTNIPRSAVGLPVSQPPPGQTRVADRSVAVVGL